MSRQPSETERPARRATPAASPDGNGRLIADRAYDELRDRIVTLRLGPGAPLREDALRAELRLGRTPLREAVKRLALEGLVEIRPRSGTFVTAIEASDIVHIAEVRAELEAQAARLAAKRVDDPRRAVAEELDAALRAIEGTRGADAYMRLDERVHRFVWETAGNPYLADALERLWALSLRIWHLVIESVPELPAAVHEQRAILDAVVAGDARRGGAHMRRHVQAFEAGILDAFSR